MTDRFSIELRKHLVETADEIVRADQLDRIERLVGTVHQQASWYVRLRWLVSPWAPYANAGVRTAIVIAAALLLLLASIGIAVVGGVGSGRGAPSTPFEGSWRAIDPGDGSALKLVVAPGPTPAVHFEDAVGAFCRASGDSSVLFLADGVGEVLGDRMVVSFPGGGCVKWQVDPFKTTFHHDSLTDTLVNNANESWTRDESPPSVP